MDTARDALPDDIAALKEALATERAKALDIAAELAVARAKASEDSALIVQQKLRIAKLERQIYGQRSERSSRLIDQLALTFEDLECDATEDELAAERAIAQTTSVCGFTRTRPERNTFPGRRSLPQARHQRRHYLQMESQIRWDGCLGAQAAADTGGREHEAEAAAGGCH